MNEEDDDNEALEMEWQEYLNELEQENKQELSDYNDENEEESDVNNEEQEEDTQLHAINAGRRPMPKEEFIRLRKEGKCFRCKQTGHFSRQCPNVSRNPRRNGGRQSNVSKY